MTTEAKVKEITPEEWAPEDCKESDCYHRNDDCADCFMEDDGTKSNYLSPDRYERYLNR